MKKLILATLIMFSAVTFLSGTKQNVLQHKAAMLADKGNLGQGDGDKGNLGQGDGDKGNLGQGDGLFDKGNLGQGDGDKGNLGQGDGGIGV